MCSSSSSKEQEESTHFGYQNVKLEEKENLVYVVGRRSSVVGRRSRSLSIHSLTLTPTLKTNTNTNTQERRIRQRGFKIRCDERSDVGYDASNVERSYGFDDGKSVRERNG